LITEAAPAISVVRIAGNVCRGYITIREVAGCPGPAEKREECDEEVARDMSSADVEAVERVFGSVGSEQKKRAVTREESKGELISSRQSRYPRFGPGRSDLQYTQREPCSAKVV